MKNNIIAGTNFSKYEAKIKLMVLSYKGSYFYRLR